MSRKAKHRKGSKQQLEYFEMALKLNGQAMEEGPKRKNWSMHDLKTIHPLTPSQEDMFHAWFNGDHVCAHGSAGTGKTFLALFLALTEVLSQKQSKLIIVRSAVPTREVGYLPGTLEEKVALYELPYHDIMWELMGRASTYQDMKDAGKIEFMTTSFIRGLTWDNAVIVVDEGQNMTFHEIDSIMTRLGDNSRVIFTGDLVQTDLDGKKQGSPGMTKAVDVFKEMKEFDCVQFNKHDIVRSAFVKSWITAAEQVI
jgi:phosphate starvation-inducible protein PhoH